MSVKYGNTKTLQAVEEVVSLDTQDSITKLQCTIL